MVRTDLQSDIHIRNMITSTTMLSIEDVTMTPLISIASNKAKSGSNLNIIAITKTFIDFNSGIKGFLSSPKELILLLYIPSNIVALSEKDFPLNLLFTWSFSYESIQVLYDSNPYAIYSIVVKVFSTPLWLICLIYVLSYLFEVLHLQILCIHFI